MRTIYLLLIIFLSSSLQSCLKDSCNQSYNYTTYTPVYMSYADLRMGIQQTEAKPIEHANKIYYRAPYLFVVETDKGIHILNNSDPNSPENISFIQIPGISDIAVKDEFLYVDSYVDLVVLNIAEPKQIFIEKRLENVFDQRVYSNGGAGDTTKGVVIDWIQHDSLITQECYQPGVFWEGDLFVSVAESSGSLQVNSTTSPGIAGSTAQFALYQDYLYCLNGSTMNLYEISNPSNPVSGNIVQMSWNIETIFPYENYLFIGSTTGVQIYDNTSPSAPTYVANFVHATSCDPVVVSGNYAYSTLRSGNTCAGFTNQLDIINISNISSPILEISYSLNQPFGLGIDFPYLFICDGSEGLKLFDVTDILHIQLLQTIPISNPIDVIPLGGLLIVVSESGIHQFDYSSGILIELSSIPTISI